MPDFEPLLTEQDAARFLNAHPGTLRNWRSKGRGPPYVAVGAAVRYAPQDLRAYIEVHTRRPHKAETA
jgi:hypothetical protein